MSRGQIIKVVKGPKPKAIEITEQALERAAEKYLQELPGLVENVVTATLLERFDETVLTHLGLERDRWYGSFKWRYPGYNSPLSEKMKSAIEEAALRILDGIDFGDITLTEAQANVIKTAYQRNLKDNLVAAARHLAEQDAMGVVAKFLGDARVPEDDPE